MPDLKGSFEPDRVLVKLRPSTTTEQIGACLGGLEHKLEGKIDELNVIILQVPNGQVAEAIALLTLCKGVDYVEPDYIASMVDTIPNDPGFGNQYGLAAVHAPQGWDMSTGSPAVTIAIIDTGIDLGHPDLAGKIVAGYDFVNNDSVPQDDNGHGTHVAGIAAATSNNGNGIAGVSWGARIMPVKVLNASGSGSFADVSAGIVWAADHGAQVINLSLGGTSASSVLQDAVNYAHSKGVVEVAAAGNSGSGFVLYPARYPNVIAVAATDNTNSRAAFSNYGPELSLAAPGVGIYSTWIGGAYRYDSGTSMSAPFVSGLAAILWGFPGNGSPDSIAWEMESTALDLGAPGPDNLYGYGLIQMDRAISLVWRPPTATPHPAGGQPVFSPYGLFLTWTPVPTFTPSATSTVTAALLPETPSQTATITSSSQTQATKPADLNALSTAEPKPWFPFPVQPCLGISLILLGILVGILSRKKQRSNRW